MSLRLATDICVRPAVKVARTVHPVQEGGEERCGIGVGRAHCGIGVGRPFWSPRTVFGSVYFRGAYLCE